MEKFLIATLRVRSTILNQIKKEKKSCKLSPTNLIFQQTSVNQTKLRSKKKKKDKNSVLTRKSWCGQRSGEAGIVSVYIKRKSKTKAHQPTYIGREAPQG